MKTMKISILLLLCWMHSAGAQVVGSPRLTATTGAQGTNSPDTTGSTPKNPGITVQQRLPVGAAMTATLTTTGNVTITNANGTVPTWSTARVQGGTQGASFSTHGIVNGMVVTDIHVEGIPDPIPVPPSVTGKAKYLSFAAFVNNGLGGLDAAGLGGWLADNGYTSTNLLAIPDFIAATVDDLYYGVDLAAWSAAGFLVEDSLFGSDFEIFDGLLGTLPGFTFGTSPFTYTDQGWVTSARFSGTVILDSFTLVGAVPEPGSLALLGFGTTLLVLTRRRIGAPRSRVAQEHLLAKTMHLKPSPHQHDVKILPCSDPNSRHA